MGLHGTKYPSCRLNVGFVFGDYLSQKLEFKFQRVKKYSLFAYRLNIDLGNFAKNGREIKIIKPITNAQDKIGNIIYNVADLSNIGTHNNL